MIIPDKEDLNLQTRDHTDFGYRYTHLLENYSPILPLHFKKEFLPKNLCQNQLLSLSQCTIFNSNTSHSCSFYIGRFQQCRKNRDLQIINSIKLWEKEHILGLDSKNRQMYLQGLTFKLDRLRQQYSKLPSNSSKANKLNHVQAEIEQTRWRMRNIKTWIEQSKRIQNIEKNNKN